MSAQNEITCDMVVIGGGPAGQSAAIEAAKSGWRVVLIEQERGVGGECVRRGTVPSKTLRESAMALLGLKRRCGAAFEVSHADDLSLSDLISRVDDVVLAHEQFMGDHLGRSGVTRVHGRARFRSPEELEVEGLDRSKTAVRAKHVVIATGSRPRMPSDVDHEHIFDSDSILSMRYLPRSLAVVGSGVIACEYACIFQALGVHVVMIDKARQPLGFLDEEICDKFSSALHDLGVRYLGGQQVKSATWDGASKVDVTLDSGVVLDVEKVMFAKGRIANLAGLDLEKAGLAPNAQGVLSVDDKYRTAVPHIRAVGDVIGPPGLATAAADQGRRAALDALGRDVGPASPFVPVGIYTLPEIASVGMTEKEARGVHGDGVMVGRGSFGDTLRGHIMANVDGMLKLVVDRDGTRILGVQAIGEGAAELVHLGELAMIGGMPVNVFVTCTFNVPTLAEAYRVAALDIANQTATAKNAAL